MITAPASCLVYAFLILFLTLLYPVAIIMFPLVLLKCFSWVTHTQSGDWISVSKTCTYFHGYDAKAHPPALLQGEISEQQSEEKGVSVEERSYLRRKKKCNLPLLVSMFLSLLYIFQKHSQVPRKNSTTTMVHRMPPRESAIICLCEPVSLTQREWRIVKGRQNFK